MIDYIKERLYFDVFKWELNNNNTNKIISFDFDDTLKDNTGLFNDRFDIFKTFMLAPDITPIIITGRLGRIDEIIEFIDYNNIKYLIKGVVYNTGYKIDALKDLNVSMHFEDDIDTTINISENKIPVMYMGEFLSDNICNIWRKNVIDNDTYKYYKIPK